VVWVGFGLEWIGLDWVGFELGLDWISVGEWIDLVSFGLEWVMGWVAWFRFVGFGWSVCSILSRFAL